MNEEQRGYQENEIARAIDLIGRGPSFDNLADAAEALASAANRSAPIGHEVKVIRDTYRPTLQELEVSERLITTKEW